MRISITLSDDIIRHAEAEAAARHDASRAANICDRKIGKQSPMVTDLVGLLGEIGFSKLFSLERDDTIEARSGSVDFIAGNGQSIEVKASHHANPHLLIPAYAIPEWAGGGYGTKEFVDIYVLMRVDYNARKVFFMGWAKRCDVIRPDRLQYFRGADRQSFVVPPEEMTQLEEHVARALAEDVASRGEIVELTQ
jgi:hypothetical protein